MPRRAHDVIDVRRHGMRLGGGRRPLYEALVFEAPLNGRHLVSHTEHAVRDLVGFLFESIAPCIHGSLALTRLKSWPNWPPVALESPCVDRGLVIEAVKRGRASLPAVESSAQIQPS